MQPTRSAPLVPMMICAVLAVGAAAVALASEAALKLSGAQEVPAVTTAALATASIVVKADKSVSGSVKTSGIEGTMAHVHVAALGKNGPPIITLTKSSEDTWAVPAGAKLTDDQYKSYVAGDLYVNVHSAAHPAGEIRAQLKP